MGESLGKIAQRRPGVRVDFFGEQPEIIGHGAGVIEHSARLFHISALREIFDWPEAADSKSSFRGRHFVIAAFVTVQQPVFFETAHDQIISAGHTWISWLPVTENAELQQARGYLAPVEFTRIAAELCVKSSRFNDVRNGVAIAPEPICEAIQRNAAAFLKLQQAIERHPTHEL